MFGQCVQHALVAWRSGLRGSSFRVIFALGMLLVAGAYLAAEFSGRQPMTVALDVGLSGIRLIVTLMALFWVQDLVAKDVDRKNLLWVLAFPAQRATYLLGRFAGIVALSAVSVLVLAAFLWLLVNRSGMGYVQSTQIHLGSAYLQTLLYLLVDVWVVTAFALLIAVLSTSAVMPLAMGAGFAIAARSMGGVLAYLLSGEAQVSPLVREAVLRAQWFLPDLSRLDIRDLCLYGLEPASLGMPLLMGVGYIAVLLALAMIALQRREFS